MSLGRNPYFGKWVHDDDAEDRPETKSGWWEHHAPGEFKPVLRVDIATGQILLDRRKDPSSKWPI